MRNDIIKKIVLAVIIVITIFILLFIGREVAVKFFGFKTPSLSKSTQLDAKKIDVDLDENTSYSHIVNDKYIYFVTTNGVVVVDDSGNKKAELPISVENPRLGASGEYVVIGDVDGNSIYIIKDSQIKQNIVTTKAIKNVSINASGNCVAITEGDMHKRDVILYNEKGEELFVWTSGTKLVFDAVVANNNKNVVISSLDTQTNNATTVLNFYNISKEEPVATETLDGEIIPDLHVFENYVYCIGESKTLTFTPTGDKKGEIPYSDKSILSYKINKNGVVMMFSQSAISDKRYSIEIYSENGHLKNTHDFEYVSEFLDASSNYITIGREGLISVIDYDGREKKLLNAGVDISDLCFVGNSNKLIGFTANGAYIFTI